MDVDAELAKCFNFLKTNPDFVLKNTSDGGADVLAPEQVPANDGFYWIFGRAVLSSGRELESVFHVDTDSSGELCAVFWLIDGTWESSQAPQVVDRLGGPASVFPVTWHFAVPLEQDVHRG